MKSLDDLIHEAGCGHFLTVRGNREFFEAFAKAVREDMVEDVIDQNFQDAQRFRKLQKTFANLSTPASERVMEELGLRGYAWWYLDTLVDESL